MKHLFIVNPSAYHVRKDLPGVLRQIEDFFLAHPDQAHEIHVNRWCRDAVGFVRRYVSETEDIVRVHAMGGSGTLNEVVNGVIDLPNAQVAAHPLGRSNEFLQYFGRNRISLFADLENQVYGDTTPIDLICNGTNYCLSNFLTGIETEGYVGGIRFGETIGFKSDLWPLMFAGLYILRNRRPGRHYQLDIDGHQVEGRFATLMIANTPCYQKNLNPAVDAHPNDGLMDVYLIDSVSRGRLLRAIIPYVSGQWAKMPDICHHYTCRSIEITCEKPVQTSFDAEVFYARKVHLTAVASAIQLVIPPQIDISQLPSIYQG